MKKSAEVQDLNMNALVNDLLKQLKAKDRQMEQLNQTIANLTETINEMKRKIFGISSEKFSHVFGIDGQFSLFEQPGGDEPAQVPETVSVSSHEKKKPRATHDELAGNVPVRTIDLTLEGNALNCPYYSTPMEAIGSKVIRKEIRITLRKSSSSSMFSIVMRARSTVQMGNSQSKKQLFQHPLMPHSMAYASAVSYVMYQKCVNYLPFYRQEKDWEQLGVKLGRGTLANWFNTCAEEYLEPVYDRLHEYFLQQSVIHADETTCQVLKEDDKTAESKFFIWLYASDAFEDHRIVICEYQQSRGGYHAVNFLADFHGYIHTDGFCGYNRLRDIIRCGCWAHLRRYLFEAIPKKKGNETQASPAIVGLVCCDQFFQIERTLKDLELEERPVLDVFWKWIDKMDAFGG